MKKFICLCNGREVAHAKSLKELKNNKEVKFHYEKMEKDSMSIYKKVK